MVPSTTYELITLYPNQSYAICAFLFEDANQGYFDSANFSVQDDSSKPAVTWFSGDNTTASTTTSSATVSATVPAETSTPSPAETLTSTSAKTPSHLSSRAKAGIAVGVLIPVLSIAALGSILLMRRRRPRHREHPGDLSLAVGIADYSKDSKNQEVGMNRTVAEANRESAGWVAEADGSTELRENPSCSEIKDDINRPNAQADGESVGLMAEADGVSPIAELEDLHSVSEIEGSEVSAYEMPG